MEKVPVYNPWDTLETHTIETLLKTRQRWMADGVSCPSGHTRESWEELLKKEINELQFELITRNF